METMESESYLVEDSEKLADESVMGARVAAIERAVTMRALTHLIGPVTGRDVLDLACGSGELARWLAAHGARVTAVDNSAESIESARNQEAREQHGIDYFVGDPDDLPFVDDSSFDDVVCNLSLERIDNMAAVVAEIARIIRLGGRFIFSVSHPCFDRRIFGPHEGCLANDYFAEGFHTGEHGTTRHRTLATYINAVAARGFTVRRVLEPGVEERDIQANPGADIQRNVPVALIVEAMFPRI
jgi:2-polyprenyl-3-methyl-5-hydroxy-6-metoxy-1,4-benzoquinol methylase